MKEKLINFLRWTEKYTGTDMIYATKGSFWIIFGKTGVFAVVFLKMIIFGRFLDQETYGTYAYILAMLGLLTVFSLPGINTSLVKAIALKKDGTFSKSIKEKLKWSVLGSITCLFLFLWYFLKQNHIIAFSFIAAGIFFPFVSVFPIFISFWMGKKNFEKKAKHEFAATFLSALIVIPVIIITKNVFLIVLALFASQAIFNGIFLLKALKAKENEEILPDVIPFGKNLTIMTAIATVASQIDKIILWKFLGAIPLAIYSFAFIPISRIQEVIPIVPLALPKLGENNVKDIKSGIIDKFKKLFILFIPITILAVLIAPLFYKLVLPQYLESIPYFQGLALLLILSPFSLLAASLVSEMKKKELYVINTIAPLLKILLFFVLIPFFQIWGIIVAILIAESLRSILILYYFLKI